MADREKVIPAFVECLCKSHKYCSECYQQGPGLGFVCRNNVCLEILEILKEQPKQNKLICKEICDFIRGSCNTDTDADKDYVCDVIQQIFIKYM